MSHENLRWTCACEPHRRQKLSSVAGDGSTHIYIYTTHSINSQHLIQWRVSQFWLSRVRMALPLRAANLCRKHQGGRLYVLVPGESGFNKRPCAVHDLGSGFGFAMRTHFPFFLHAFSCVPPRRARHQAISYDRSVPNPYGG